MRKCIECEKWISEDSNQVNNMKFCGQKCKNKYNYRKNNTPSLKINTPSTQFNTPLIPHKPMSETESYLLRDRIAELQGVIKEYKVEKEKAETKHEAITKEKDSHLKSLTKEHETELKALTKEFNDLTLKHNTVQTKHEQELNGIEQNKRSFEGDKSEKKEFFDRQDDIYIPHI